MIDVTQTIRDIQRAQKANETLIRNLDPRHALGEATRLVLADMHRYTLVVTHIDTGSLRAAHRMDFRTKPTTATGIISIDPGATNPRTRERPADYGQEEHARGGEHAFYNRAVAENADRALDLGTRILARSVV